MEVFKGDFGSAVAYTNGLDACTAGQITGLCDQPFSEGLKIRIMPDAHAGAGCVIGTTMNIRDKIVPNLVGVDIGCGMETVKLAPCEIDFKALDKIIRRLVPFGKGARKQRHGFADQSRLEELRCQDVIFGGKDGPKIKDRAYRSIGSLGSGNHFIELDRDEDNGDIYLVIHSGSRNPGLETAVSYQKLAQKTCGKNVPAPLAYLEGENMANYLHDMKIMQEYADLNRRAIAQVIIEGMGWEAVERFATVHNYVNFEDMILRKGAVSAHKGEKLLIPFNMRDGSVICEGLGNEEWNCSAPHGAGRLTSRTEAFKNLNLDDFKRDMEGIYSSCISRATIDESPQAYKPKDAILASLPETAKIIKVLKPVYNFKASS